MTLRFVTDNDFKEVIVVELRKLLPDLDIFNYEFENMVRHIPI